MQPNENQFDNVVDLKAYKESKEEQLQPGERMWGPQHAGVVPVKKKDD